MLAIGLLHFQILWRSVEAFLGVFFVCLNGMFAPPGAVDILSQSLVGNKVPDEAPDSISLVVDKKSE